jgi:hypothetical protein
MYFSYNWDILKNQNQTLELASTHKDNKVFQINNHQVIASGVLTVSFTPLWHANKDPKFVDPTSYFFIALTN